MYMYIFKWSHWDLQRFRRILTNGPIKSLFICSQLWDLFKRVSTFLLDCTQGGKKNGHDWGLIHSSQNSSYATERCIMMEDTQHYEYRNSWNFRTTLGIHSPTHLVNKSAAENSLWARSGGRQSLQSSPATKHIFWTAILKWNALLLRNYHFNYIPREQSRFICDSL